MKMVALGEVAEIERRGVDPATVDPATRYIGLEHIERGGRIISDETVADAALSSTKFHFSSQHVLFGKLRPNLGKIARPDTVGICSTDILPVRPGPSLDRDYLFHYLSQPTTVALAASQATGANLPRLSPTVLSEFDLPLPPLDEQRRIAAILDHADALRAKRRQTLAHFDKLASSIFYEMFGDPVLNAKGWPVYRFGDQITSMQYGPRFYNESYSTQGVRIVRISDLNQYGRLDFDSMPKMAVSDDGLHKFCLSPGDIVFARTGATVGKLAIIREHDPPCIAGAYFIRIRLREGVEPEYVAAVLRSRRIQSIIVSGSHQSAQQNFSGPGLRSLPLPLPPTRLQRQFSKALASLTERRLPGARAESSVEQLFASLQSRAFSGQL